MYLEREDITVEEVDNGTDGLELALENDYDAILLDIMMPGMDGIEVCEKLREQKQTPVIMLTAKGEESNRVQGFEVGADDYIVKQFSPREVVIRVKAVLRRVKESSFSRTTANNLIVFPHLTIDIDSYSITSSTVEIY